MQLIEKSSLDAYAEKFWERQGQKANHDDHPAISGIKNGESPVSWLANLYPYKLPKPYNTTERLGVRSFNHTSLLSARLNLRLTVE
jgi:hypothetical protein